MGLKIRRRARLRRKEATDFLGRLADEFGMEVPLDDVPLDEAEAGPHRLLLRNNDAIAVFLESGIAPTIRGLLAFPAKKRAVTVDMGAVRFIYNGRRRDGPGDRRRGPRVRAGDVVWVRDEKNGRPLAIGRAIMDGPTMAREEKARRSRRFHPSATRFGGSAKRSLDVPGLRAVLSTSTGRSSTRATPGSRHSTRVFASIRKTSISGSEAAQWIGTADSR